jgi:Permease family
MNSHAWGRYSAQETDAMVKKIEAYFELRKNGTNIRTEVLAGIATFLMMAYIIVVNPGILSKAGMPFSGVLFATVIVSALSSIAMGLYSNLPYSLAPGMGINAFFTFSIVLGMGIGWQTALGAVFISGICFIILSLTGLRTGIVKAIPGITQAWSCGRNRPLSGFNRAGKCRLYRPEQGDRRGLRRCDPHNYTVHNGHDLYLGIADQESHGRFYHRYFFYVLFITHHLIRRLMGGLAENPACDNAG